MNINLVNLKRLNVVCTFFSIRKDRCSRFVLSAQNLIHLDVPLMIVTFKLFLISLDRLALCAVFFFWLSVIKLSRSISWRGVADGFVAWNWSAVWLLAVTLMAAAAVSEPLVRNWLSFHRSCRTHNIPLSYKDFLVTGWLAPMDNILFRTGS